MSFLVEVVVDRAMNRGASLRMINAPLLQQVLDVPKRQRVTDNHHYREAMISGLVLKSRKMRALLIRSG